LNTFGQNVVPVWLAPSEGLLLDKIGFVGYNRKNDAPEVLELNEEELLESNEFKKNMIYESIIAE
jgi:hypothetical protein